MVKTEIIDITPEIANGFLSRNSKNRHINHKRVDELAREMSEGRFQFNGDTIRIDADGEMLDGQHRCHACVKAGVSFRSIVVTGLERSVMPTIDQHSKRTGGHVLQILGVNNANATAAVARHSAGIANGDLRSTRVSATELLEILAAHPDIEKSASRTRKSFPKCGTMLGAIHYIASFLGKTEDAEAFVSVWETGVPHYSGCAAHVARERAMRSNSSSTNKMTSTDLMKMIIGAWNNFEKRAPVSKAYIPADPKIKGWSIGELKRPEAF